MSVLWNLKNKHPQLTEVVEITLKRQLATPLCTSTLIPLKGSLKTKIDSIVKNKLIKVLYFLGNNRR